jgi:ABC-type glutathione transport system ATPase component
MVGIRPSLEFPRSYGEACFVRIAEITPQILEHSAGAPISGGDVENQPTDSAALLETRGLTKIFGSLRACDGIDLAIAPGEVHALLGENGAGKSTLVKMLFGVLDPSAGEHSVEGQADQHRQPGRGPRPPASAWFSSIFRCSKR